MIREQRSVEDFDQVRFKGPGNLKISQSDEESLTIIAPEYVLQHIECYVDSGVLTLGYVSPMIALLKVHRETISYELRMKEVSAVDLLGSGNVLIPDLDNDHVRIRVKGSGRVVLEQLTADKFEAKISGSGKIKVVGDVEIQSINLSGSGDYNADTLISDFADIRVSGSGHARVSVSDELTVNISGSGVVSYAGYPDIYKQITGSGKVVRRRKENAKSTRGKGHA